MDAPLKTGIVEATGFATTGRRRSADFESAMHAALAEIEKESDAIWQDGAISAEEKRKRIEALNTPDAKRARMLAARNAVKAGLAEAERRKAAAANLKAAEEALAAAKAAAEQAGVTK